ncbi:hypothetical protein BH09PLA1_BH09PLA1_14020 [soil metagenome]
MRRIATLLLVFICIAGCSAQSDRIRPSQSNVIFLVPGVAGPSRSYQNLIDGIHDGGIDRPVQIVSWGAPSMFFFMNFSNTSIHESAERSLAERITKWHAEHPNATIDIVAHSAGCGVTLGALKQLPQGCTVSTIVLLAPSVSPQYELEPATRAVTGITHVYFSDRDTTFLEWRTGNFGTYDNIKTPAAGNRGFVSAPPGVKQHGYDPSWNSLGNDGGHFGGLSRSFARDVIAPLLSSPVPSRSSGANPR